MAGDIGVKIKLDGESEFRNQVKNITAESKALQSELKKVVSEFDAETTAQEKAAKKSEVLNKQIANQEKYVKLLSDRYEKASAELGENATETLKLKDQLNKAETALNNMNKELDATEKEANDYETEIKEATEGNEQFTQSIGQLLGNEKLQEFFSSAAQKIGEFASSAVDAAKELDEGYDTIAKKTGATGDQLEELKDIANDVYGSMPVEMADVGSAVGEVSTRFKQSGDQLQKTTEDFLKFARINDTDVSDSIDSVDRIMKTFHVDASDTSNVLGLLTSAAQNSGITVDALTSQLDQNGATFAELGYSVQDAASLLATFEANGVDASGVMTALKKSITNAAKEGKDANSVLADAEDRIKNASSETEALQIATEIFGTRGAVVMVNGLRDGRISLKRTEKALDSYGNVVNDTFEATLSPWDKTTTALNNLKTVASELAGNALSTLVPAIEKVTDVVKKVSDWFNRLSPTAQKVIGVFTAVTAAAAIVGPKIMAVVTTLKQLKTASDLTRSIQGMSGEMQTASGSAGGLAKEIGLVGGAIALAIGSVVAFTEAQKAWRIKTDENYASLVNLAEANKTLASEASYTRGTIDDLKASYYGNAEEVDRLAARLDELNGKQSLTAEESEEYRTTVEKLAFLLPGFSSEIDQSTGKLKDQGQVTRENVEALKQMAAAAAAQNGLEQALQASTEAAVKQKQALDNMREALKAMGVETNYTDDELVSMARSCRETTGFVSTLVDSMGLGAQYANAFNNAMAEGVKAYDEYGSQISDADALIARYTADMDAAASATSNLEAEAQNTWNSVSETVQSTAPVIEQGAYEIGYGSGEGYAEGAAASAGEVESATSTLAGTISNGLKNLATSINTKKTGTDISSNLALGITSGLPKLVTSVLNLTKPVAGIPKTLAAVQPSVRAAGMSIAAGLANGMTSGSGVVSSAASTLANAAKISVSSSTYNAQGQSIAQGFANGITSNTSLVSSAAKTAAAAAKITVNSKDYNYIGAAIATGLAQGITNSKFVVESAAKGAVSSAIKAAKERAGIHSPSKEFAYLGEMSVEGYAKGLTAGARTVEKATQRMISLPSASDVGNRGVSNSYSNSYGDIVVNVSGANVSDPARLADMVADRINRQVLSRRAAFA